LRKRGVEEAVLFAEGLNVCPGVCCFGLKSHVGVYGCMC
jgi:hypothetical protein